HAAAGAEEEQVGSADGDAELADRAQQREQPHTRYGAEDAAGQQHQGEREVERTAAPIGNRAGHGGGRDVARHGRHRYRRRYPDEDQQRRHQEAAADAEHAGDEPDREPHREHEEYIDRKVGDREVNFHGLDPTVRGGVNFVLAGGSLWRKATGSTGIPLTRKRKVFLPAGGAVNRLAAEMPRQRAPHGAQRNAGRG